MKKILAILLTAAMLLSILPMAVFAADEESALITAADFVSYEADGGVAITDYSGTQNGVTFTGIKAEQLTYQPRFYFTEDGISKIKSCAEENGYDCLTINAWGIFSNNSGVINNKLWFGADKWQKMNVDIATLDTGFYFWFASEQTGTMYLWFEFKEAPIVDKDSFTDQYWIAEEDGSFTMNSAAYQPHYYFSQAGIDRMKAYAEKHDVDTLLITGQYSGTNSLVLDNKMWIGQGEVKTLAVRIADMTTSFDIWSQSEGLTMINLKFDAYKAPLINSTSFKGNGMNFEDAMGVTVGDEIVDGVHIKSAAYQPHFNFTEAAIEAIKAYAEENDVDTIRINATYAGTNCLVLNNQKWIGTDKPGTLDVPIADLSTAFDFWSQSESNTEIMLWFDFYKAPLINASSFTGLGGFTNNLDGTVNLFTGEYQPHFRFTEEAIAAIKAYAEENNLETLRITVDYDGTNALVLNNKYWVDSSAVVPCDFLVEDLTAAFDFWSQSESTTNLTLSFEFVHAVHDYQETDSQKVTCIADGYTTYVCTVCGDTYTDTFEKLGHDFVDGFCSRCGLEETHEHNFIPGETVTPTCTEDGYTVYTCTCGESYQDDIVPALGHDYVADEEDSKEATCTEDGADATKCSRCGDVQSETIPALGHDYVADEEDSKAATCTEDGVSATKCSRCGDVQTEPIPALGHDFVDGICSRCGDEDPNYVKPDPCEGYTDIDRSKWYHSAADYVIENGYMGSTTTESLVFEPNTKVSRSMVASILYRICGSPAVTYKGTFTDVKNGKWFTNAIEWCAQNGLASGKGDGTFDPNGNVTRQELAVFMYKLAEYRGADVSGEADLATFPDGNTVPSWAETYVAWAVNAGLISGKASGGKTILAPKDNATRAEFASIIMRFMQNIA